MKLKVYKNERQHEVAECPFCPYFVYTRRGEAGALRYMRNHITNMAQKEALARFIAGENAPASEVPKHLAYCKKHSKEKPVVSTIIKRQYDGDLTI